MKDFLFPQVCLGCGKMGKTVCEVCLSNISETTNQLCPGCGKESGSTGKTCIRCWLVDFPLEGLLFGQIYLHTGIFGKLIRGLKYDHCLDAIPYLGDLMVRCIHNGYFNKDVMLIPIPLTRKRLWVRGFNQAELLADYVASTTGLALYSKMLIRRDNHNHSQTLACDRVRRFEQIKGAFYLNESADLPNKNRGVILVDDVYTTGATMCEAARTLKRKFPGLTVWGLVAGRSV